ncbi:Cell division protein FtsA [subsurface metagenome]
MKRTKIAAIDVGTTKVCTIMADMNGTEALRILGVGTAESRGLEKGVVVNVRDTAVSISQSVKKAEKMSGCRLKSAYVSVSGADMSSLNNHGLISISRHNQLVHTADRNRALEVARSVEVPEDQRLLHVIPRSYTLDGQENIKNPVSMHGFRLDVETHIVTAPAVSVQNLAKCIMSLGVGIDGFILKSLASAEAVLTEDERQRGVILADIGGGTTNVAAFKDGSVYHTSTLPVGGYNVTNDIALGLGLPFCVAEEMKTKYGNVMPSEEEGNDDVTVTENGRSVSYHDLCEIINARVEELLRLILFQMPQTNYAEAFPPGLVLTGGGCNLPGIAELGREITQFPVKVGTSLNPDGSNDTLCDPAYATSVGLLYWKMKNEGLQDWRTNRGRLSVLLPRWSSYFISRK